MPILSWVYCYISSKRQVPEEVCADGRDAQRVAAVSAKPYSTLESPALVMFDSKGKGIHARLMPAKGVDFEGLDRTLKLWAGDLDRLGYKRVAFRSDTEISIVSFLRELKNHWSGEVVP